jgi:arginyl-tRNA synthetase
MDFPAQLQSRLVNALASAGIEVPAGMPVEVVAAQDARFGDYQTNVAMILAKAAKSNPRELAGRITGAFDGSGLCAEPTIAGPGFINFRLESSALAQAVAAITSDENAGVATAKEPEVIVLDFSAPNVAKPMHVGHIRSTIIGDSLARVARFLGHHVITDNHIGDWGTQFGMILHGWKTRRDADALATDPVAELLRLYRETNAAAKADPAVMETCKAELVKLQAGDEENLAIWRECVELTKRGLQGIYDQLDVRFDHWLGESYYNDALAPMVEEMLASGLARESDGAVCIFSGGELPAEQDPFKVHKEDGWQDNPAIIRKADGGFLYATTDLATLDFRIREWKADEIWYVVGAPQQLHFRQIFDAAKRWGKSARCQHVAFGSILGEDRKLMRTRSGDNVQLADVLSEAVERALAAIEAKNPDLPENEKAEIATIVGIGAVKYAELSQHRLTDYVFSWDKMLSLQGNTAPYLQNAYVRIQAIFRKAAAEGIATDGTDTAPDLQDPTEIALALKLARFAEAVPSVLDDFRPNLLANYLYELATTFHSFYEACPVLKPETAAFRDSRLLLCRATATVLRTGLGLLGIRVPEKM